MLGFALGLGALGVVLATGIAWFRRALSLRLPESLLGFFAAMALGLALSVAAFACEPGWLGGVAAGMAALGSSFFFFTSAIGGQKGGSGSLQIGQPVPDFTAPDEHGQPFNLASVSGRPLLLKFFRGHW